VLGEDPRGQADHVGAFPRNSLFPSTLARAILSLAMMSATAKRITSKSSMSIASTTTKKTISASGAWRNS
jgi:hypothetical protein